MLELTPQFPGSADSEELNPTCWMTEVEVKIEEESIIMALMQTLHSTVITHKSGDLPVISSEQNHDIILTLILFLFPFAFLVLI